MALDLAKQVDQCVSGALAPRPRGTVDRGDQPVRVVERCSPDGHRDAGERTRSDQGLEIADLTAVVLRHQRADQFGECRCEPRLGNVGKHGGPRPDGLGVVEHSDDAAFLQPGDRRDQLGQVVDTGFEHDVARQCLDHVANRSPHVALERRADPGDHLVGAIADARESEHALAIGSTAEQSDEADLSGVRGANRDRGHARRAMHGGNRVGARDHDVGVAVLRRRIDSLGVEEP